ncbi:TIM barrel protein [Streptomyces sp. UNOB3_S3]|uniref:TIM barrel protein n=1 Tax=Streptomyces sp. UNOB3_S3 TaxID=2871682 RepID=UPI001E4517A0|nr:TIM barrel protein [Streptomyces sp. UNOB3_S3]
MGLRRFDANLSILFTELPLTARPAAAAAAGFTEVELWWPWPEDPEPPEAELAALRDALTAAGTRLVALNFYAGRLPGPDRGALSVPGEESARFRANIGVAAAFAASVGCRALNALYGNRVDGVAPDVQDALALENLAHAARAADRVGAILLIEALNSVESPRYPLTDVASAVEVVEKVDAVTGLGNARLLLDLYHVAMGGADPRDAVDRYAQRAGHVQIADVPGRGAPGTGALDFADLFARLDAAGYDGPVGLEYRAANGPGADDFGRLAAF